MEEWHLILAGAGIVGSTVGITKLMLSGAVKAIKEHCAHQTDFCSRRLGNIEDDAKSRWKALNEHGHKGLDGNGNKVTR